jgi:hypothetical protein
VRHGAKGNLKGRTTGRRNLAQAWSQERWNGMKDDSRISNPALDEEIHPVVWHRLDGCRDVLSASFAAYCEVASARGRDVEHAESIGEKKAKMCTDKYNFGHPPAK